MPALYLNDTDTNGEKQQRKPLCRAESSAKKHNRERCCGQNLHLVADLECRGIEIGHGDELEIILNDV